MVTAIKTIHLPITKFIFSFVPPFVPFFVPSFYVPFLPSIFFFESLKRIHYVGTLWCSSFSLLWRGRTRYFTFPFNWELLPHSTNFISQIPIIQNPDTK